MALCNSIFIFINSVHIWSPSPSSGGGEENRRMEKGMDEGTIKTQNP
jgi:hypothetical protein